MSDIYNAPKSELTTDSLNSGQWGSLESGLAGNYQLRPIEIMGEAWDTLKGLKTPVLLGVLMVFAVSIIVGVLSASLGLSASPFDEPQAIPTGSQVGTEMLLQLISTFITVPMGAGIFIMSLKHATGGTATASETLAYFGKALPMLGLVILAYILIAIGFLLLILPGIYLGVCFYMAIPLMADKNLGIVEALKASRQATHHKFFPMLGLVLLCTLIVILGALALGIGLIWAIPMASLMMAIAYRNMFGIGV